MKRLDIRKVALAGLFCAVAVLGSLFSFPAFGSKCAPVQHAVNILCAVLLGPGYGLAVAFSAALIRNVLGMFGALLCGLVYAKTKSIPGTLLGEVFGTAVLGGLCAYPVAIFWMGKSAAGLAFYVFVVPFLISTVGGAILAAILIYSLQTAGLLRHMREAIHG